MMTTLFKLIPQHSRRDLKVHAALTVTSLLVRAVAIVLLVPLVAALFSPTPTEAWPWVAALGAVTVIGWFIDRTVARLGFNLGFELLDHAQQAVAKQIARTRLDWFTSTNTAMTRQAVAATGPDLVGLVVWLLTPLVSAVLLPVAIAVALLPVSWPLGLAALAGVPLLLTAFFASGRLSRDADRTATAANAQWTERIIEFARAQQALRASRRAEPARSQVGNALATQHQATFRLLLLQIPGQVLFGLASQVALLLLAGTTVVLTARGSLSAPEAVALIVVIVRYLEPFSALAALAPGIENASGILRKLRSVLDAPTVASGQEIAHHPHRPPRVELRRVGFAYAPDEPPVFANLSLTLESGTTTAIVGPSGSGKSTILALLAGLHQPSTGAVLIDGVDAVTLDSDVRRNLVSVVFQQPYLFDGTIKDNILAGRPTAPQEAVWEAVELARVDTLLRRLPLGWETQVGEGGTTVSGGERQRISIARALLKCAPLLLVDEATSALDHENEQAIVAALHQDRTPRTRVIVAHHLSTIASADRVLFVEQGRIVEDGSVEELLGSGGRFAEFWAQQEAARGWQLQGTA